MVDIWVDVPDELVELLNRRAAKNGRSAEEEIRAIFVEAATNDLMDKD
ncbi:MAG TPA: hypothetical protein VII56_23270 [Rhizomicrobium sp.]